MANHQDADQRGSLEQKIAESMDELRQLHSRPRLDDFQEYRRNRLNNNLTVLRQKLSHSEQILLRSPVGRALLPDGGRTFELGMVGTITGVWVPSSPRARCAILIGFPSLVDESPPRVRQILAPDAGPSVAKLFVIPSVGRALLLAMCGRASKPVRSTKARLFVLPSFFCPSDLFCYSERSEESLHHMDDHITRRF